LLALAVLPPLALHGCVCPPEPEDVLAVGFRTPEKAFRTFQTATRLDDPDLELRCFSMGFRERHGIGQLTWREARVELYGRQPWLRAGIAGATIEDLDADVGRARLRVDTAGGDYVVVLVREDFAEAWAGEARVLDEATPWWRTTGIQDGEGGRRWIFGRVALPLGVDGAQVTDLRFGREWKIDDVGPLAETGESSPRRAEVP
jgi:hypothetical protein